MAFPRFFICEARQRIKKGKKRGGRGSVSHSCHLAGSMKEGGVKNSFLYFLEDGRTEKRGIGGRKGRGGKREGRKGAESGGGPMVYKTARMGGREKGLRVSSRIQRKGKKGESGS